MSALRPRRRVVPVSVGLIAAGTAATVWMLTHGTRGAEIATVLALPVAVAGLLIAWFGSRMGSDSADQLRADACRLARDVRGQEAAVLATLMADSGDPHPAEVSFAQPALTYWRADGGDERGTLSEIKKYYTGLDRGRLVVLGKPGAGKTVLALQLILDLATAVRVAADDARPLPRVPVRLSLPAFDPGGIGDLNLMPAKVVAARLDDWLVQHLVTVFGMTNRVATAMVTDGWVLPVLDGLDEMDPDDEVPQRAAAVIRAVNHPSAGGPRPVVITCRTGRYQQLSGPLDPVPATTVTGAQTTSNIPRREVVQDATVVRVEPLTIPQAINYLTYRFPDPTDPAHIQPRWQSVIDRITATSSAADEPLAAALRSPLRLFLMTTAYRDPASTPDEITSLATTDQIDEHLFVRLVPAALEQHPPPGRQYTSPAVTHWLTTLTRHLASQGQHRGSSSDLQLHLLGSAAGQHIPRYAATALMTTLAAAFLLVNSFLYVILVGWPRESLAIYLGLCAVIVVFVAWRASRPAVHLQRLDVNILSTPAGRRQLGRWLAAGFVGALVTGSWWGSWRGSIRARGRAHVRALGRTRIRAHDASVRY